MRILVVTNMYPTAETPTLGTFIEQQIKGLREIGLDVQVMLVNRAGDGMRVYLSVPSRLRTKIESFDPDLVHVMYGGVMAAQVSRSTLKPMIVTFHGSDLLGHQVSGVSRKFTAGVGILASWRAARWANRIIIVSRNLQTALPKDVNPSKISIIPCGIDLERFQPIDRDICRNQLGWDASHFHVLFPSNAGNLVKRPVLAQSAVEALNHFGIRAKMHYLHNVPNNEVPIWLNASDVLLLTSLYEGSPTIVKEALACNLPVVSVDVGDVSDRLKGLEGCYLASPDADDLAGKLFLVHSGKPRVNSRHNMKEFALERIAHRLENLYDEVLHVSSEPSDSTICSV